MSAFHLIQELVSSPYEFHWEFHRRSAHFTTSKGTKYFVHFYREDMKNNIYEMTFKVKDNLNYDKTSEGDSFRVMTTVFFILNEFLSKSPYSKVFFASLNSKLKNLYSRGLKRYAKRHGLKYEGVWVTRKGSLDNLETGIGWQSQDLAQS